MKKPFVRIAGFSLLLPAIQLVSLWLILAFAAVVTPPDILLQAFLALPLIILMLYQIPHWLFAAFVAKPAGVEMPTQSLVFISSSIIFFACILLLATGIYTGLITPTEAFALFYFVSFMVLFPVVLFTWTKPNNTLDAR